MAFTTISHEPAPSLSAWKVAVGDSCPLECSFTKTLVLKQKTGKAPGLLVCIALEATETRTNVIAKAVGAKEARMAPVDMIEQVLHEKPENVSFLSITHNNAAAIQVVVDAKLLTHKGTLAFHPSDTSKTVFVSHDDVKSHLQRVGCAFVELDFGEVLVSAAAKAVPKKVSKPGKDDAKIDGAALIGITIQKELDFSSWYQQILVKGDMLEYYDVSGCYIMRPWSYGIWERIQRWLDDNIKSIGVENAYFPMFVSSKVLEREKDHVEGFAPEVAWVTKA